MYSYLKDDKENIDEIIHGFYLYSANLLKDFNARKVGLIQEKFPIDKISDNGLGYFRTLDKFVQKYEKHLSASTGARYFGFVTGGSTPASLIGDWLASLYDQNVANLGESCSANITYETISLLKELFSLDDSFEGIFVSGATMSNFVGLATARQWFGNHYNKNIAIDGITSVKETLNIYSASPHASVYKSLSMLGLGKNSLKLIKTNENTETINIPDLEKHLKSQNNIPCIVVANAGTVNTVGFDDLEAIHKLKEKYNFWIHTDAAFGGFARCSSLHKHLIQGLEKSDSITIDAHKWLNVPYDSAMHFTKHLEIQFEVFKNTAAYLQQNYSNQNYVHLTPENSQRLRALPIWFSLNAYGKEGYSEIVQRNCALALEVSQKIKASNKFVLLSEVVLNGVLFTLNTKDISLEQINIFVQKIKEDGRIFITPSFYNNTPALRISISNWQTTSEDINMAWEALCDVYDAIK